MLLSRSLPPQFLLPAWNTRQLVALQQRACKTDDTGFKTLKSNVIPSSKNKPQSPTPKQERSPTTEQVPGALSLFEELFPDESETKKKAADRREQLERLPAFGWGKTGQNTVSENAHRDAGWKQKENGFREQRQRSGYLTLKRAGEGWGRKREEPSVLVLNSATKTLEESDFFRLGPKGEHIEGWTSGIIKVIPGRDNYTLRSLGHYFILFSDSASARAYLDNTFRLWQAARTKGQWESSGVAGLPLPPGILRPDEDVQKLIRGFTLTPPWTKLFLRMAEKPYRQGLRQVLDDGGPAAIADRKSKAEDMVLISTDAGQISLAELSGVIKFDGRRRNLHWKLANVEDPIVRLHGPERDEDEGENSRNRGKRALKSLERYVISFRDRHEARRFVREWHKRPISRRPEVSRRPGQESPPIINAEVLW